MNGAELVGTIVIIFTCMLVIGWVITKIGELLGFRAPPDPDDRSTWYDQ